MTRFHRGGALIGCLLAALLLPPAALAATVSFDAAVTGRVTDRAGQPVADATISVAELGRATTSDREGRFRLGALPAGRYTISARRLGYVTGAATVVVAASPIDVQIVLDASAVPDAVERGRLVTRPDADPQPDAEA